MLNYYSYFDSYFPSNRQDSDRHNYYFSTSRYPHDRTGQDGNDPPLFNHGQYQLLVINVSVIMVSNSSYQLDTIIQMVAIFCKQLIVSINDQLHTFELVPGKGGMSPIQFINLHRFTKSDWKFSYFLHIHTHTHTFTSVTRPSPWAGTHII